MPRVFPTFYVSQFDAIWRVEPFALQRLLEEGAATGSYSIDGPGVTRVQERISQATLRRLCGLPRKWRSRARLILFPLDQPQSWFAEMLAALKAKDFEALRGFIAEEDLQARLAAQAPPA